MSDLPSLRASALASRLSDWRAWRERIVVWLAAIVAGLCVVAFTKMTEFAANLFQTIRAHGVAWPLLLTPLGGMLAVWIARKWAPGSAGSGIPQVMVCLDPSVPPSRIRHFVSTRLSIVKSVCGALALSVGFSSGREGPSVQIAAGIMHGFRRFLGPDSRIQPNDLMLAGGAAGIAAAFNTPLAGVMFAIEELSRRFEQRSSGVIVTAIIIAGLVSVSVFGNLNYFGRLTIEETRLALLLPAIVCALVSGVLGGLFSRLLIVSSAGGKDRITAFRVAHPIWFAGACGLVVAILGLVSGGSAHGSGYELTRGLLAHEESVPFLYAGVKFIATWVSYWSGIPGGIFAPALSVGAGIGYDIAMLTHSELMMPLVALGMVGFLAAVTQAPITSFIIVMEMIDGHTMVLSLMATALVASLISRLISPPLYHSLAQLQLQGAKAAETAAAGGASDDDAAPDREQDASLDGIESAEQTPDTREPQ